MKTWNTARLVCSAVICIAVLSCVAIAAMRSKGLVAVRVTALADELSDHDVPFLKRNEALPDYELSILSDDGSSCYLGTKPNTSASGGLTWTLDTTVPVSLIASVRLVEKDKLVSDTIAEVHVVADSVTSNDYRFDFDCQHSFAAGLAAFFRTPVGIAICIALVIAILYVLLSNVL